MNHSKGTPSSRAKHGDLPFIHYDNLKSRLPRSFSFHQSFTHNEWGLAVTAQ